MVDATPRQLVNATFDTLGLDGLFPEVMVIGDTHYSRTVLLPFSATVSEPVRIFAIVTPTELTLSAERFRILTSGIDVNKVLRDGDSSLPRLCASVTLDRGTRSLNIEKKIVEGAADLVFERDIVRLSGNPADDVVRQMVVSLLNAMDRLGLGSEGLNWTSAEFRPRPMGGVPKAAILAVMVIGAGYFLRRSISHADRAVSI